MSDNKLAICIMVCLLFMMGIPAHTQSDICNIDAPTQFIPATDGRVIATDGLSLYAEQSADSQIIADLTTGTPLTAWYGATCNEDGLWWFVETEMIAGWLTERVPANDAYLIAPLDPPDTDFFRPRAGDDPRPIEAEALQFLLSASVAMNAETRWVLANEDTNNPQSSAYPTHRHVTFDAPMTIEPDPAFQGSLRVHPAEAWERFTTLSLDDLRTQIDERPDIPTLTGLQAVGAVRLLNIYPGYVDFQNGSGIRALVQYTQTGAPVVDGGLLYQFAGITDDGRYLVQVTFGLESTLLPTTEERSAAFNFDAFAAYLDVTDETFMLGMSEMLATAPDESFTPRISDLDSLINSLLVEIPEWCSAVPSLLLFGDTVQTTLETSPLRVRGSANGTPVDNFLPGETAVITGGPVCIDGIVWWEAMQVNEWVGWIAELEGDTYYLTRVTEP